MNSIPFHYDDQGNFCATISIPVMLDKLCNPVGMSIWHNINRPITKSEVLKVPFDKLIDNPYPTSMTRALHDKSYTRRWHVCRIAHLLRNGWDDPIELEISDGSYGGWPITDGNHRFLAAVFREDLTIEAHVGGYLDNANDIFQWMEPEVFKTELNRQWLEYLRKSK